MDEFNRPLMQMFHHLLRHYLMLELPALQLFLFALKFQALFEQELLLERVSYYLKNIFFFKFSVKIWRQNSTE